MTVLRRRVGGNWYNIAGAVRVPRPPGRPAFTGAVTPSSGSAIVAWSAPLTAGSPVTGYVVTATPGGATASVGAGARTATIAGLDNGTSYTFTVKATSAAGDSPLSLAAGPVTPAAEQLVERTAANTGPLGVFDGALGRNLTYDDLTVHSGSYTLTTPDVTYYRVRFDAVPVVSADNVTFNQCLIRPPRNALYSVSYGNGKPLGLTMIDTEIDGQGTDLIGGEAPSALIKPGIGYTLRRVRAHHGLDLLKPQDVPVGHSVLVEDSLLDHPCFPTGSHSDVTQIAGGGAENVTIRRSTLNGYRPDLAPPRRASSSLVQLGSFPKDGQGLNKGVLRNILFEDCIIEGGTYGARLSVETAAVCQNFVFRRIRFRLHHQYGAFSGTPGATNPATDGGRPVVESCTWHETGVTDFGLSVTAGQGV